MSWAQIPVFGGALKIKSRRELRTAERMREVWVLDLGLAVISFWDKATIEKYAPAPFVGQIATREITEREAQVWQDEQRATSHRAPPLQDIVDDLRAASEQAAERASEPD